MIETDVIVIGGGVAGLTAAITARKLGLEVLVVEKTPWFGGTAAFSGGAPWIPCNHVMREAGFSDTREAAEQYLHAVLGDLYDPVRIKAFLDAGPEMLKFMEQNSEVHFKSVPMPDYEMKPGAAVSRTLLTKEYDGLRLGDQLKNLRPQMSQLMLFGSLQLEGSDIHPLRKAFKSWPAFKHTARLMTRFMASRIAHGRGMRLANGNALAGRLLRSAIDSGVTLWNDTPARELVTEAGAVRGVVIEKDGQRVQATARRGVLLASGGFGANAEMRAKYIPFAAHHWSLQPDENVGDGINLGVAAGGVLNVDNAGECIWTPVSVLRKKDGSVLKYPHIFIDRAMPGSIAVDSEGKRFANEGGSYQNFVKAMHDKGLTTVHLIAGRAFLRSYGMGLARPAPFDERPYVEAGYLVEAPTLEALAGKIGADPAVLTATVQRFNDNVAKNVDPDFGRGADAHSLFRGDQSHRPNTSLGAIGAGPYYALAMHPGDLSTVMGLDTDGEARVIDRTGRVVPGLYAAGLDMNSIMRGLYPGGGSSIGPAMTFGYIAARHMSRNERPATTTTAARPQLQAVA